MRVYVGQTRSRALVARLAELGFGEMTQPREYPPRRHPWALDNGAFSLWRSGQPFDGEAWRSVLTSVASCEAGGGPPAFAVCPDLVAGGLDSLAYSRRWLPDCASVLPVPWYLVTQDGMSDYDVREAVRGDGFAGLFVGGTLPWKLVTGARWCTLARDLGVPCHIGRVGTPRRVAWARRIGAESIDSALPLWSEGNLRRFLAAVDRVQRDLFD